MEEYKNLVNRVLSCRRCPFSVPHSWPASGNLNSRIMIVDESVNAMAKDKDIVEMMLKEIDLAKDDVYITPLIKCGLDRLTKAMKQALFKHCIDFLIKEIEIVHPKVIIALGATADDAVRFIRNNVRSDFIYIHLPHPNMVIYGSIRLGTYMDNAKKKLKDLP